MTPVLAARASVQRLEVATNLMNARVIWPAGLLPAHPALAAFLCAVSTILTILAGLTRVRTRASRIKKVSHNRS